MAPRNWVVLVVGLLLAGLSGVGAAELTTDAGTERSPGSGIVELRIGKIVALGPLTGSVEFQWGNESVSVPLALRTGQTLAASHRFAGVTLGDPHAIRITDTAGVTILRTGGVFDGAELRLLEADVDEDRLALSPVESSIRVVVGSVTGDFIVRVAFRTAEAARASQVTVGLDGNGDGAVDPSEETRLGGSERVLDGTHRVVDVPSLSAWTLAVAHSGTIVAAYHGMYDLLEGTIATELPDRLDESAPEVLEVIQFAPVRRSLSGEHKIPNILLLRNIQASEDLVALPNLGVIMTYGEPVLEGAEGSAGNTSENVEPTSAANPLVGKGRLVPIIVGATVLIFAAGLFFRRGRKYRRREVEVSEGDG